MPPAHAASALEGSLSRAPSPPGPCLSADHCSLRVTTSRPSSMSDPCRALLEGNVCVPEGAPTRTSSLLHTQPPPIWIQATPPAPPRCSWVLPMLLVCVWAVGGGGVLPLLSSPSGPGTFLAGCWSAGRRASGGPCPGLRLLPKARRPLQHFPAGEERGPSTRETGLLLQAPCELGPRGPHCKHQGPLSSHQTLRGQGQLGGLSMQPSPSAAPPAFS